MLFLWGFNRIVARSVWWYEYYAVSCCRWWWWQYRILETYTHVFVRQKSYHFHAIGNRRRDEHNDRDKRLGTPFIQLLVVTPKRGEHDLCLFANKHNISFTKCICIHDVSIECTRNINIARTDPPLAVCALTGMLSGNQEQQKMK